MENMHSLKNRLRFHAERNGSSQTVLRVYKNQVCWLIKEGFSVQKLDLKDCLPGQYRCQISWQNVNEEGTFAYELMLISSEKQPPVIHPSGGWDII